MNARALALATALAGTALGACTGANESAPVALSAICALTDDCTFAATCDAQYIGDFTFDRSMATEFWLPIQVNNRLVNNGDAALGRANTADAHITSFEMTYTGFPLASASMPTNYRVQAGGSATVGLYLVPPQPALLAAPAATTQVTVKVKAKGYLEDGTSFETGDFPLAFWYCDGCVAPRYVCATAGDVFAIACGGRGTLPVKGGCITP